jgi:hypothetical protein
MVYVVIIIFVPFEYVVPFCTLLMAKLETSVTDGLSAALKGKVDYCRVKALSVLFEEVVVSMML